jgi:hypothetical protein
MIKNTDPTAATAALNTEPLEQNFLNRLQTWKGGGGGGGGGERTKEGAFCSQIWEVHTLLWMSHSIYFVKFPRRSRSKEIYLIHSPKLELGPSLFSHNVY